VHRLAAVVDQRPHPAPCGAGDDEIALLQGAALDQHRGHRPAAALKLGLDDDAIGGAVRVGGDVEHLGLQQDGVEQLVEIEPLSAETSTSRVSPPMLSTTISCDSRSVRTRVGLASGLSILLMATITGTPAALAW
jgi:hypothetical protein